jgi:hypothetical protein
MNDQLLVVNLSKILYFQDLQNFMPDSGRVAPPRGDPRQQQEVQVRNVLRHAQV